jgi:hypothetical protein
MKYTLSISAALLLAMSQAQPSLAQNGASNLVKQAIAAEGGADALRALKGLAIKGEAKFWEPGQSKVAGGEPKLLEEATFTITWDLATGMARTEWDRDHKYPDPVLKINYIETVLPTLGFVTDQQGAKGMSGVRIAAHLRELERASPTLLLKAVDDPKSVGAMGPQKLGKESLPAISLMAGGTKFTVLFDSKTHLPAAIRTRDDDNVHGDSDFDLVLGDWKAPLHGVGGVRAVLPGQRRRGREAHLPGCVCESDDRGRCVQRARCGQSDGEGSGDRQCALSVGAAPSRHVALR